MRAALVPALAVAAFAACAAPEPAAPPDAAPPAAERPPLVADTLRAFDARAWLREARATAEGLDVQEVGYDDPRVGRLKALADQLGAAVDWRRACDAERDPETGALTYEPQPDDAFSWPRGIVGVFPLADADEALVAVTCDFGAYQGFYALVHVGGDRARLVRTTAFDEAYAPDGEATTFATVRDVDAAARTFTTFALARGVGDCGEWARYRLPVPALSDAAVTAEVVEVRARECGDAIPDDLPPPEAWPVVVPQGR